MAKLTAALLGFALQAAVLAGPLPAPARAEVNALLARLQSSGCQFNRNGSWYTGAEARKHLLRKLEYLEDKSLVTSAEQFIDKGAAASSASGKAYLVKCADARPVESKAWLLAELKAMRAR